MYVSSTLYSTHTYTFNIIVKINFHPYVLVKRQKLKPQRLAFCDWFTRMNNQNYLQNLIISDEAIFSMNSDVILRNVIQ